MFNTMKKMIQSKNFALEDMKERLKNLTAHGDLTPEQRSELEQMAEAAADPLKDMDMKQTIMNHEQRIKALEKLLAQAGGNVGTPDDGDADEYPPYRQPSGAHDCYWRGDKMTYTDGVRYICDAPEGVPVVYSPDVMASYWKKAEA